jgi:hypothetical protein
MATLTNFDVEQSDNSKKLILKETTAAYDANNNTDGWGTPNEDTTDAVTTTLTITAPDETVTALTSTELAGLASFPTTDTSLELSISTQDLGGDTDVAHADGVYTFSYEIVTGTTTYTTEHKVFVSGQARCCVYGMLADVDTVDCDCDATEKTDALEAFTFYRSLIALAADGNETKYTETLAIVNELCDGCKCEDC